MLEMTIENLKSINHFNISLPDKKGVYLITGENGIGKSTIFAALSKLFYKRALNTAFKFENPGARVSYCVDGITNTWIKSTRTWERVDKNPEICCDGTIESSLVFGSRFANVHKNLLEKVNHVQDIDLIDADDFVIKNLGLILRDDEKFYAGLKKIKTDQIAKDLGFVRTSYFWVNNQNHLHLAQLLMSSGELLLIGLLDFLNIQKNSSKKDKERIILIDEIELALHPSSLFRLINLLNKISNESNLCIFIATHSLEIINSVDPSNIFYLERSKTNNIQVINPCYSAYATRSLYTNDGFDFLLLVEDNLAKHFVDKILNKNNLQNNKLIKVLPCGGWDQVLKIHSEFKNSKIAGGACKIVSILDGDAEEEYNKYREFNKDNKYEFLTKCFLPIKSIEKYIYDNLHKNRDEEFVRSFGDRFFVYKSLNSILVEFNRNLLSGSNHKETDLGKDLWKKLIEESNIQGVSKELFETRVCDFIINRTDISKFESTVLRFFS